MVDLFLLVVLVAVIFFQFGDGIHLSVKIDGKEHRIDIDKDQKK